RLINLHPPASLRCQPNRRQRTARQCRQPVVMVYPLCRLEKPVEGRSALSSKAEIFYAPAHYATPVVPNPSAPPIRAHLHRPKSFAPPEDISTVRRARHPQAQVLLPLSAPTGKAVRQLQEQMSLFSPANHSKRNQESPLW